MEVTLQQHIDGVWYTSEDSYKNRKLLIKMKESKGAKIHVFHPNSDKVDFTLRVNFQYATELINKAKFKIDRNDKLYEAWAYCDWKDKSTEFMLEYMQDVANVNLDSVLNFMKKNSKNRAIWYKNNPNWINKYK